VIRQTLGSEYEYVDIFSDRRLIMVCLLPPVMILSSLPSLKSLAPSIALASFLMALSFVFIGVLICFNWEDGVDEWESSHASLRDYLDEINWKLVPLATCAIMYSLEGDQLIIPIESSMTNPRRFGKVLIFSFTIIGLLFCVFGSACSVAFGKVDNGSITAYLMDHRTELEGFHGSTMPLSPYQFLLLTNVIVSLSVFFTYPLQLFPAIGLSGQIVCRWIHNKRYNDLDNNHLSDESTALIDFKPADKISNGHENENEPIVDMEGDSLLLRYCLVISTVVVAIVIPHLKALIALAGAVTGAATSLIIPPTLALKFTLKDEVKISKWRSILFYSLLIMIGWVYAIFGTISSVQDVISIYNGDAE